MTLDELLSIQATIEKRAVPIDILEEEYTYYSKSKDEHINLLDLHLIHFIRIFLKLVEEDKNIRFLVLASSANNEEPGPLIKALTGKKIKDLSIPMVIIPGSLSEKEIDLIA